MKLKITLLTIDLLKFKTGTNMNNNDNRTVFSETRLRSLVKTITYRAVSIIGTMIITWFLTHDIEKMLSITFSIQIFLIVLYYFSERLWDRVKWGRSVVEK